jgi:hypothetical protein
MVYGAWTMPSAALLLALPVASVFADFAYLVNETYFDTGLFAASMFSMALPFSVFLARLFADESWSALAYHPGNAITAMCGGTARDVPTIWLGKHVQGVPTYAGRRLLRGMQLNNGPLSLGAFVMAWAMFALLQVFTLFLYLLWVFLLFPLWLPNLIIGYFFYQTKVLALRRTQNAWVGLWSMNYGQLFSEVPAEESFDYVWFVESLSADVFLRALPQLFIQYWNNTHRQQWSMLGQISFLITVVLVVAYFLYKLLALCFPSLQPESEFDDEEEQEEETVHGSPGSRASRRSSTTSRNARRHRSSEHGLEMTDLYPNDVDNQQVVASIASDVKSLTKKFDSADKELWLLLVGDQKDLRAVTLMRAYGLVRPKDLARSSDHNLQQLRALIAGVTKEEQAEPENKLRGAHFDRLCVQMREDNPEGGIVAMVKGAVAYVSGKRSGDTAATLPPSQTGMLSYLVPMLVRSDSKAAVAIRQRSRRLDLRQLGDLDEGSQEGRDGDDSPGEGASVSFTDFFAAAVSSWWQARVLGFSLFLANSRWIIYGEADAPEGSEGAAPGAGGVLVRISGSTSRAAAALQASCVGAYVSFVSAFAASPEGEQRNVSGGPILFRVAYTGGIVCRTMIRAAQAVAAGAMTLAVILCAGLGTGVSGACSGVWWILRGDAPQEAEPSEDAIPWSARPRLLAEAALAAVVGAYLNLRWIALGNEGNVTGEAGEVEGLEGVGTRLYGSSLRAAAAAWEGCVWAMSACYAGLLAAPAFARRCWNGDPEAGAPEQEEGSALGLRGVCIRISGSTSRCGAAIGETCAGAARSVSSSAAACIARREGEEEGTGEAAEVPPMHVRALSAVAGAGRAVQTQVVGSVQSCATRGRACMGGTAGREAGEATAEAAVEAGVEGGTRTAERAGNPDAPDDDETAYERFRRLSNEAFELFLSFFG